MEDNELRVGHVKSVVCTHKFTSKCIETSCSQVNVRSELKVDIWMSSVGVREWEQWECVNSHRGAEGRVEDRCINIRKTLRNRTRETEKAGRNPGSL